MCKSYYAHFSQKIKGYNKMGVLHLPLLPLIVVF